MLPVYTDLIYTHSTRGCFAKLAPNDSAKSAKMAERKKEREREHFARNCYTFVAALVSLFPTLSSSMDVLISGSHYHQSNVFVASFLATACIVFIHFIWLLFGWLSGIFPSVISG